MRNRMYDDYDNVECDECGLEIKVVVINGKLYNICGCGDALNVGDAYEHWIPEKWR